MANLRCFECPTTMVSSVDLSDVRFAHVWICQECAHERGLTPKLAERIAIEDAKWGNPACIWEACPKELMRMILDPITEQLEAEADGLNIDGDNRDRWVSYKIAHRVVTIMNHIWFGPEVLLK